MRDQRQQAIRGILATGVMTTQFDLLEALQKAGLAVDQSTLSRDLAELGVRKSGGRYVLPNGEVAGGTATATAGVDYAGVVCGFLPCGPHMIVLRTNVGQAQPVSLWLDAKREPSIVGTLAGDDTIFLATKNSKTQAVALRRLEAWFGDKRER